jgi:hypothetical protein
VATTLTTHGYRLQVAALKPYNPLVAGTVSLR